MFVLAINRHEKKIISFSTVLPLYLGYISELSLTILLLAFRVIPRGFFCVRTYGNNSTGRYGCFKRLRPGSRTQATVTSQERTRLPASGWNRFKVAFTPTTNQSVIGQLRRGTQPHAVESWGHGFVRRSHVLPGGGI